MYRFIINDTYRSDICLLYPPHLIAISAIYLTLILHNPTRSVIVPLLSSSPSIPLPSTTTSEEKQKLRRSTRSTASPRQQSSPSVSSSTTAEKKSHQDPITFLSELNVSFSLISTISQEIISLYTLWDRYKEDVNPEAKTPSLPHTYPLPQTHHTHPHPQSYSHFGFASSNPFPPPLLPNMPISNTLPSNMALPMSMPLSMSLPTQGVGDSSGIDGGTDVTVQKMKDRAVDGAGHAQPITVTITPVFLSGLLHRMRESRAFDAIQQGQRNVNVSVGAAGIGGGYDHGMHGVHGALIHGVHYAPVHGHGHGQGSVIHGYGQIYGISGMTDGMRVQQIQGRGSVAVNKILERTQAAG